MIYVTGDTHNTVDCEKIFQFAPSLAISDYIIIAGDFGGCWYNHGSDKYKNDQELLDRYSNLDCTILFVDGNHENFPEIYSYPTIEKFGGTVGQIREKVFHLRRGEIYNIQNKKIFTFGGALSVDKHMRMPYVSWWEEEIPTIEEMNYGIDNLEKHNNKVDYIITHTAPKEIVQALVAKNKWNMWGNKANDPTTDYLQRVMQITEFKHWYFGHFHDDKRIKRSGDFTAKFTTLYNEFDKLK